MKKLIWTIYAMLGMTACNGTLVEEVVSHGSDEVRISTGVSSRAPQLGEDGSGHFQAGDEIYLTACGSVAGGWYAGGYVLDKSKLYWGDLPVGRDEEAVFTACYPLPDKVEGTSFTFDILNVAYSDLLMANQVKVRYGMSVNLTFRHVMHKLSIKYVPGNGGLSEAELQNITTTCKGNTVCSIDLKAANVMDGSASSPGTYGTHTGSGVSFLLVPQKASEVTLALSLTDGRVLEKTLSEWCVNNPVISLESGKELKLVFEVTSDDTGDNVQLVASQISGWEEQGSVEDEIII